MAVTLTEEQLALLREPHLGHVATVMADGTPQVTPVWVDTDGEALRFNTAAGRLKHRNIVRNPWVAVSVVDSNNPYRVLAIRGRAEMTEAGADDHIDLLAKKYLGVETYPMRQPGERRVTVRVIPERVLSMG